MDSPIVGKRKTSEETTSAESGERLDLLDTIDAAIQAIQKSLKAKGCEKVSLSDLVRLLQLRKELAEERPRHVSVRWIDSDEC
jgi:TusA-related sulfurtransferase